ncbi:MAG: AFG1 family ATPase [Rhizobiales bacterium]|nr:AFG1 family ATPase [Hyphomicrobiales bacterium]
MPADSGEIAGTPGPVAARYDALVADGSVTPDPAQRALVARLDRLVEELAEARPASRGALARLFGPRPKRALRGLYVHGAVGRGKTMLMDVFFAAAPVPDKRRAHFHDFMADVHERIHKARQATRDGKGRADPIAPVAASIAAETRLLCLDEFAVEDIADAMILSRLFEALFANGLVLVATSNAEPEALYRNGLNRALFVPFIAILRQHVDVVELGARTDYRLEKLGRAPVYVTPLGAEARGALDRIWRSLTGTEHGEAGTLTVKGRALRVPEVARGVARFSFRDLCETALGAGDYAAIARAFHTVIVDDVPVIDPARRDVARRFINLVDVLYDRGIKLVASAAAEPEGLYRASSGEEAFAFRRTASRLTEMRSAEYLAAATRAAAAVPAEGPDEA